MTTANSTQFKGLSKTIVLLFFTSISSLSFFSTMILPVSLESVPNLESVKLDNIKELTQKQHTLEASLDYLNVSKSQFNCHQRPIYFNQKNFQQATSKFTKGIQIILIITTLILEVFPSHELPRRIIINKRSTTNIVKMFRLLLRSIRVNEWHKLTW